MIPSARPYVGEEEVKSVRRVIKSCWLTQGPRVREFESLFSQYVGSKHACAVSNCTTALHLGLLALGVKPGNVVITVSHSFVSTANCIRYCGAEPVFIDIDLESYNISPDKLRDFLETKCLSRSGKLYYKNIAKTLHSSSPLKNLKPSSEFARVGAILVVHQMGMPTDMPAILKLARKYKLRVIEDAAGALGSEIRIGSKWQRIGRPHGDIACFSFHPLKIITTGEGGMLTTNSAAIDKELRLLRHQGMGVSDLKRHKSKKLIIEKYPVLGYNYRMSDVQASIGITQLKKLKALVRRRREVAKKYNQGLANVSWLKLPVEPRHMRSNYQGYAVQVLRKSPIKRNMLMQKLRNHGILTRLGIMNAHEEKPYRHKKVKLPHSETARHKSLILPNYFALSSSKQNKVIRVLKSF